MGFKKSTEYVRWLRDQKKWFALSGKILKTLNSARGGGTFSKALAGVEIVDSIIS